MAMKKITRRWLVNGLGVIFVILLGVMIAFSIGVRSFYYSSVQQIILSRSSVISTLLQTYAQDSSVNFSQELQNIVETFDVPGDHGADGHRWTAATVMMTSSGFLPEEDLSMPDFEGRSPPRMASMSFSGRIRDGENIMAVFGWQPWSDQPEPGRHRAMWSRWSRVDGQITLLTAMHAARCAWPSFCLSSSPAPTSSTPSSTR